MLPDLLGTQLSKTHCESDDLSGSALGISVVRVTLATSSLDHLADLPFSVQGA